MTRFKCSKCIICLYTMLLLVCGAIVMYMGQLVVGNSLEDILSYTGMSLVIMGIVGYFGIITENRYIFLTFSLTATLLFLFEIVTLLFVYQSTTTFEDFTTTNLKQLMKGYKNDEKSKEIVDNVQWTLRCCGATNTSDLLHVLDHYPESCCDRNLIQRGIKCAISQYKTSCLSAIKNNLLTNFTIGLIVLIVMEILFVQIISLISSWYLTKEYHFLASINNNA